MNFAFIQCNLVEPVAVDVETSKFVIFNLALQLLMLSPRFIMVSNVIRYYWITLAEKTNPCYLMEHDWKMFYGTEKIKLLIWDLHFKF